MVRRPGRRTPSWFGSGGGTVPESRSPPSKPRAPGVRRDHYDPFRREVAPAGAVGGNRTAAPCAAHDDTDRSARTHQHDGLSTGLATRRRPAPVSRSAFAGFRFPAEVITVAVRWYLRYGLSYRDVEELLAERGVEVDHVTVYRWVQRFTPLFADAARFARHAPGDRWFVDETYVKVDGVWRYVYRAVDQHGQVIDVYVSVRRDGQAARRFFQRAMTTLKVRPAEVVTDAAPVYPRVLDELVPAAYHRTRGGRPGLIGRPDVGRASASSTGIGRMVRRHVLLVIWLEIGWRPPCLYRVGASSGSASTHGVPRGTGRRLPLVAVGAPRSGRLDRGGVRTSAASPSDEWPPDAVAAPDSQSIRGVAMAELKYSVYVAPSKPAVSDDLPPGEDRRMWSPTARRSSTARATRSWWTRS